jgi:hypothetical protein
MTIKKKLKISTVFTTVLFVTILFVSVANAQGNETTQKNATAKPTFYPETSNPYFVAEYGSIPTFTTAEEESKWGATLSKILNNFSVDFSQDQKVTNYFDPFGPIKTSTVTSYGFIEISLNNSSTVNKSFLDEFYNIIDSEANRMGVNDVPVVFIREDNLILADLKTLNSTNNNSNSINESASDISNSSGNKSGTSNKVSSIPNKNSSDISNSSGNKSGTSNKVSSTPGFELLGSLVCMCVGWKLRKM